MAGPSWGTSKAAFLPLLFRASGTAAALVCAGAAMLLPARVQAQEVTQNATSAVARLMGEPYRLEYDHLDASFTLYRTDGKVVRGWNHVPAARAQALALPVPPNRPLELAVVNANALVYTYRFEASAVGSRPVRACGDIGRDFLAQSFFTTTQALLGADQPVPTLDAVMKEAAAFRTAADNVAKSGFGFGGDERNAALVRARARAAAFQRLADQLNQLSLSLTDSIQLIAIRADVEPIDTLVGRLFRAVEADAHGFSDPRMVPVVVATQYRGVSDLIAAAKQGAGPNDQIAADAETLHQSLKESYKKARTDVQLLQQALVKLGRARSLSRQSTVLMPSEIGKALSITLSAQPDAEKIGVVPVRAGTVKAYTRPSVSMLCQISVGLNWMRPGADYQIDRTGKIVDNTGTDDVRTAPAVFFSFGPAALPVLGLLGGVGLGTGGRPDLYLGASLRALTPVLINLGSVWQRESVLPNGYTSGQAAPPGIDTFERAFKASWFLGLSFSR